MYIYIFRLCVLQYVGLKNVCTTWEWGICIGKCSICFSRHVVYLELYAAGSLPKFVTKNFPRMVCSDSRLIDIKLFILA